jgi:hypothetical protein
VKGGGHHREGPLDPCPRQFGKSASIGKAGGMNDRIDGTKGGACGANKFAGRISAGEIAG